MSTWKRLSKRSLLGTKVMVPGQDGRYYAGHIQAVKAADNFSSSGTPEKRYAVRFEDSKRVFEFSEKAIIGPGFRSTSDVHLLEGQVVYVTVNNREMAARVVRHDFEAGDVLLKVQNTGHSDAAAAAAAAEEETLLATIDDVRLMESRKSARLLNSDTDFSKLADVNISLEKRKAKNNSTSIAIEVPKSDYVQITGSRKRRTSENLPDEEEVLSECSAAMLLMKLSCSPHSPSLATSAPTSTATFLSDLPSPAGSSSGASSFRSATPSPPLSSSHTDEGIVKDLELTKNAVRTIYQCTFPGCREQHLSVSSIEQHIRRQHLNRPEDEHLDDEYNDHEEEFYFTEIDVPAAQVEAALKRQIKHAPAASVTTVVEAGNAPQDLRLNPSFQLMPSLGLADHLDMARPAHEDPGQRKRVHSMASAVHRRQNNNFALAQAQQSLLSTSLPNQPLSFPQMGSSPGKLILISPPARGMSTSNAAATGGSGSTGTSGKSPVKRVRDGKKCRKVYGLEQRDLWCTQCKWKKACARFGSNATEGGQLQQQGQQQQGQVQVQVQGAAGQHTTPTQQQSTKPLLQIPQISPVPLNGVKALKL